MDIDLATVGEFEFHIAEVQFKAKLTGYGQNGELLFVPIDPLKDTFIGEACTVSFRWDGRIYQFEGECFIPDLTKIVTIRKSDFTLEKRASMRIKANEMACTVTQKKSFLEKTAFSGFVGDLSEQGAQLLLDVELQKDTPYALQVPLRKKTFLTGFLVKRVVPQERMFVHGVRFVSTSPEDVKALHDFLEDMTGEAKPHDQVLDQINFEKIWKKIDSHGAGRSSRRRI